MVMSEPYSPPVESGDEDGEHPLKRGIDAAKRGETASLEDILSEIG